MIGDVTRCLWSLLEQTGRQMDTQYHALSQADALTKNWEITIWKDQALSAPPWFDVPQLCSPWMGKRWEYQKRQGGSYKGKNAAKRSRQHATIQRRSSSTKGRLPSKVVFHQRLSSTEGHLPPKFIFPRRSFSTKDHLPPKVVFHQR